MKIRIADIKVGPRFREDYGDIDELATSMARFGQLHPIVVSRDMELIAGSRRLRAAIKLGWDEIEAVVREDADELERRELELEENIRRKQFDWPEEVRAKREIHKLKQQKYGAGTRGKPNDGWTMRDTAEALGVSVGTVSQDIELAEALDHVPELAKEKSKMTAFRKWQRLKERLLLQELARRKMERGERPLENAYHGDCVDVLRTLPDGSVDLVVTDPPFAISLHKSTLARAQVIDYVDEPSEVLETLNAALKELYRVLRQNAHVYVFFDIAQHSTILDMLRRAGFEPDPVPIIWAKEGKDHQAYFSAYRWKMAYEACFFAAKGDLKLDATRPLVNVLRFPVVPQKEKLHIAQKPVALVRELIEASSAPGDLVLDPFAGSGTTAIAALQSGRRYIVIERDQATYQTLVERIAAEGSTDAAVGGDETES